MSQPNFIALCTTPHSKRFVNLILQNKFLSTICPMPNPSDPNTRSLFWGSNSSEDVYLAVHMKSNVFFSFCSTELNNPHYKEFMEARNHEDAEIASISFQTLFKNPYDNSVEFFSCNAYTSHLLLLSKNDLFDNHPKLLVDGIIELLSCDDLFASMFVDDVNRLLSKGL